MAPKLSQTGKRLALALTAAAVGTAGVATWKIENPSYANADARIEAVCGTSDPDGILESDIGRTTEEIRDAIDEKVFSDVPRKEIGAIGGCLEALKADDGVITPKEEELLSIWVGEYIDHLFPEGVGGADTMTAEINKISLQVFADYLIATLAHSPNSTEQIAALERLYDATHATWIVGGHGPEWDMDEFERPGSVLESDAGLLSRLLTDFIIHVRDGYAENIEPTDDAYERYEESLVHIEEALRAIDFGFDRSKHGEAAAGLNLDGLRLGTIHTDPRRQLFELMATFNSHGKMEMSELENEKKDKPMDVKVIDGLADLANGAMDLLNGGAMKVAEIVKDFEEGGLAALGEAAKSKLAQQLFLICPYDEVLYNLSQQESEIGEFFDQILNMKANEAAEYFKIQILGNRKLMIRNASEAWMPNDSDARLLYESGVQWGNFNPIEYLDVKFTLSALGLTPDRIRDIVTEYKTNQESIEKRPSGKTIAEATWGKNADAINGAVENWVLANLGKEFKARRMSERLAWVDEAADYSTRVIWPWVGLSVQLGKTGIDYHDMVEANENLGKIDTAQATAVTTFNAAEELSRFWVAARTFSPKGLVFGKASGVSRGFLMKVFLPLEAVDLWADPQIDPDLGWTTRQERGEKFLDSWAEKFRAIILLPLIGIGRWRREKWREASYKKRLMESGPRTAAALDFTVGVSSRAVKVITKGVRGGLRGVLAIPGAIGEIARNWGLDEEAFEAAVDRFDREEGDGPDFDNEWDPLGEPDGGFDSDEFIEKSRRADANRREGEFEPKA